MIGYIFYYVGEKDDLNTVRARMQKGLEHVVNVWKIKRNRLVLKYSGRSEETRVTLQTVSQKYKNRLRVLLISTSQMRYTN